MGSTLSTPTVTLVTKAERNIRNDVPISGRVEGGSSGWKYTWSACDSKLEFTSRPVNVRMYAMDDNRYMEEPHYSFYAQELHTGRVHRIETLDGEDMSRDTCKLPAPLGTWVEKVLKLPEGPAPPVPQRPAVLPDSAASWGPPQAHVEPRKWALQLNQFIQFLDACMSTECWKHLEADIGIVNTYMMNEHFVKPWTKGSGRSVALQMNQTPQNADLMISHCWGEDVQQLREVLQGYIDNRDSTGMHRGGRDNIYAFFCTLSLYQPEDGASAGLSIEEQVKRDPFRAVISGNPAHGMLVVHTSACDLYTRLWCIYELFLAILNGVHVEMAFHPSAVTPVVQRPNAFLGGIDKFLIDAEAASCTRESDAVKIRRNVRSLPGGFPKLSATIARRRALAAAELTEEGNRMHDSHMAAFRTEDDPALLTTADLMIEIDKEFADRGCTGDSAPA